MIKPVVFLALVLTLCCAGCQPAQQEAFSATLDINATAKPIIPDDYDAIYLVATWCPYSDEFVEVMNRLILSGSVNGEKIAFIVADEWGKVEEALEEEQWSSERIAEFKDEKMSEALFPIFIVDEGKLYDYPSDVFVYPGSPQDLKFTYEGFPAGYNSSNLSFDHHATDSLSKLGIGD